MKKLLKSLSFCLIVVSLFVIASCEQLPDVEDPTNPPGDLPDISDIVFGTEDAFNNGNISGITNSFSTGETEVFYKIVIQRGFGAKHKIRKLWKKDNNNVLTAIQILDTLHTQIFGVFKKNNGEALEDGNYELILQMRDGSYTLSARAGAQNDNHSIL